MKRKLISIVMPAYNEEGNVVNMHKALDAEFSESLFAYDVEILFVNDGSSDGTLEQIRALAARDPRVRGICLSRNFGHQAALTAGMEQAKGDVIITMDCDLQDPPELISQMMERWEAGNKIVYARRTARHDRPFKKITAALYYKLLSMVSEVNIPRQVGDFRLLDRMVLDELMKLDEHARYLRGMVAWLGFKHDFVDFERQERVHGETHYPLRKMMKLAMDGLLNFTFLPMKLGLWVGVLSIIVAIYFLGYMYWDSLDGTPYPLYKWLVVILFAFVGAQFIFIWVIGEYISRIYNDVRKRPLYVVEETIKGEGKD